VIERFTMFVGYIDKPAGGSGGGLHHEGEDIEVLRIPFAEALRMVDTGEIVDSKTVILLQHVALKGLLA
jgi:hypothetical protein